MPFEIAFLSDLHLDRTHAPGSWDLAQAAFEAARSADHVVVAGDLFDSAGAMRRDRSHVERALKTLGLWAPDRLTVVVGNHDIFEPAHHGGPLKHVASLLRVLRAGARRNLELLSDWFGELVPREDREHDDALFPYRRRLRGVTLVAADSTPRLTAWASQGAWDAEEDAGVRALLEGAPGLRVVATHFPPERGIMPFSILERLRGVPGGYLETDLRRLRELLEEQRVDLVVAGHVHAGKDRWAWDLGRTSVRVVGRSGAVHGATPCYGLLTVLPSGKFEWCTVNL